MPGPSLRARAPSRALVFVVLSLAPSLAAAQEPTTSPPPEAEGFAPAEEVTDTSSTSSRPPAVEIETAKKVRHNWYAGFGVGLGAGNLRRTDAGANALSVALLGHVRAGGRIRDNLLIGGLVSTTLGGARNSQGLFSGLVEVIGYPVKGKGLVMQGALGLGTYVQTELSSMTASLSRTAFGIAFGLGVGYEFWLARRFNLGIVVRGDGLGAGTGVGLRAAGTLGLAFTWY